MSLIAGHHSVAVDDGPPYAGYAQIVRMLAPLTEKVGFYDTQGEALWISDGVEEPELRGCVEALLDRHARHVATTEPPERHGSPLYALPIRGADGSLLGALGLALRGGGGDVSHAMRSSTTERLLAPLLEIIAYGWRREGASAPPPAPQTRATQAPNPAVLRRTLALAIQRIECAFGAIVLADRAFTFSHRVSTEDSDVTINAVIDAVRDHMLKLMQVRREPLIANRIAGARLLSAPYKLLVYPVRSHDERLVALIMLFRTTHERDFVLWDVEALQEIGDDLCIDVLTAPVAARALPAREPEPPVPLVQEERPSARGAPAPTLETRIRHALVHDGFDLHAQHIAGLRANSHPHRFEVLLRMHDAGKLRAPGAFFGAAHAQNLMPELDRWVVRTLLQTLRAHAQTVRSGQWEFCLNVAGQSLTDEGFSEFVVAEVCRSTVPPGLLVFEFSEVNALEHSKAIEVMAARLRDVGCRIALDNCRAGFETLSTLRKWPVSRVKIDGVLTREVTSSPRAEALVRAVVQLAAGVGVETVAECVESEAVRAKLLDIGVDYAQGFHLAKPQPLASLLPG
jgi:EAL domain-containing protein (putative c-di-GMP-specific phosphodiesterase class I)